MLDSITVAREYGAYKFEDAMEMAPSVRRLLAQAAEVEKEKFWFRLERTLGVLWSRDDFRDGKVENTGVLRMPLALALNPEILAHVEKSLKSTTSSATNSPTFLLLSEKDRKMFAKSVSLGSMSADEARDFFKEASKAPGGS